MSKNFKTIACALTLGIASFNALAVTTVKATVNGMVCAFCAQGIEKRLSALPATQSVFVDLKAKVVAVEIKEGKAADTAAIQAEIVDAGYDVVKLETLAQPLAEVKGGAGAKAPAP